MPRAVFRFDATPAIGGGHFARCRLLARELIETRWNVGFAVSQETFASQSFDRDTACIVPADEEQTEPAQLRSRWPDGIDLLVVDHYERGAPFAQALRGWAARIMTFDDAGTNPDWADIVADFTPSEGDPIFLSRSGKLNLRGPSWSPLDRRFHALRLDLPAPNRTVDRILISAGAMDAADATSGVLDALASIGFDGSVDIALTSVAPHLDHVRKKAQLAPFDAQLHVDSAHIPELMAAADLIVGAGGTSSWERACLGKPSLVLIVADNQMRNAAALEQRQAAVVIDARAGIEMPALAEALRGLLTDRKKRKELGHHALALTDGLGAGRLALAIDPLRDKAARAIRFRSAAATDMETVFRWQTAPGARRFARNPEPPAWGEHREWFARKLASKDCIFSIVMAEAEPVGFVRLDARGENSFEVSILIDQNQQGKGVALAALAGARRLLPNAIFVAEVHPDNAASLALFRGAGYAYDGKLFTQAPTRKSAA